MSDHTIINEASVVNLGKLSDYTVSSPFPKADCAFNWLNCAYPFEHTHNYYEILIVTAGEYIHYINGKTFSLKEGDAYLIRPTDSHKILPSLNGQSARHINLLVQKPFARKLFNLYEENLDETLTDAKDELSFTLSAGTLSKLINSCLAMQSETVPYEKKVLQCKIIVSRIINTFLEQKFPLVSAYPKWFSELLLLLNDPKLDLRAEEISNTTPYSYSRLARIFKKIMGISIVDYQRKIKMNFAAELLKTTDNSVLEIVYELGYNSVSYFNHTFRDYFGVSPSAYRRNEL